VLARQIFLVVLEGIVVDYHNYYSTILGYVLAAALCNSSLLVAGHCIIVVVLVISPLITGRCGYSPEIPTNKRNL